MKGFKKYLMIALAILSQSSYAGWEKTTNGLSSGQIVIGANIQVVDDQLAFMLANPTTYSYNFWNEQALAKVKLSFEDDDYQYFSQDWSLNIQYQLDLRDATGVVKTIHRNIEVNYDLQAGGEYIDKAIQLEKGYHEMNLVITGITSVGLGTIPTSMRLDLELDIERYWVLTTGTPTIQIVGNPNVNTVFGLDNTSGWNELPLAWNLINEAESYDLEWLFVDYADAVAASSTSGLSGDQLPIPNTPISVSDLDIDFRKATRINTTENHYTISLAYPRGFILYRVRTIKVNQATGNRKEGAWSAQATTSHLSSYASYPEMLIGYGGIENNKNWQYSVAYAEEGKRKELMSYFDGALYSRQNVTVVNSEDNAIVGQKIYDKQGRSALNVLPSPVSDDNLTYHENLVMKDNTDLYDADNFDTELLIENPNTVSDQFGPGKYYSPNNTIGTVNKDLVPDAEGYPFSRTIYSHDGLNRPVKVAGLGAELKITSSGDRTAEYFYGRPAGTEELDRVFGNEVGTTGYKKHMASDQNGQVSVSYLDIQDRVIATAVAKDQASATENLIGLNSGDYNSGPDQVVISDLLDGNNELQNDFLISMTPITVDLQQTINFHYDANADNLSYNIELCNGNNLFNPDRAYEFSVYIGIRDEDNKYIDLSGTGISSYIVTVAAGEEYIEIPHTSAGQNFDFSAVLMPGKTYYIEKRLGLDADLYNEFYTAFSNAISTNTCSLNDFELINEQFGTNYNWNTPVMVCGAVMNCMISQGYTPIYSLQGAITHYEDAQGATISLTSVTHDNCVEQDIADNGLSVMGEFPNACEIEKTNILSAMSPGGMYYDNTPESNTPNYDDLGWLEHIDNYKTHNDINAVLATNPYKVFLYNFLFPNNSNPVGAAIANWNNFKIGMEAYALNGNFGVAQGTLLSWDDSYWEIIMMELHPEYEVYNCKCVDKSAEFSSPNPGVYTDHISEFSDFYADFYLTNDDQTAINEGYFNPFGSNSSTLAIPIAPNTGTFNYDVSFIQSLGLCDVNPVNLTKTDGFLMKGTEIPGGTRQPLDNGILFDDLYDDLTDFITVNSNTYSVWDVVATAFYYDANGTYSPIPLADITANTELNTLLNSTDGLLIKFNNVSEVSKIEYFRSKYYFFREYRWYEYVKGCAQSPFYYSYDELEPYSVVFPENDVYEMYTAGTTSGFALLDEEIQCNAVAEDWADVLIGQMQLNTNSIFYEFNNYHALSQLGSSTGNFTNLNTDINTLRSDLIDILKAEECDPSNPSLSSYFTGTTYTYLDVMLVYDAGSTATLKVCENGNTNNCQNLDYFDYTLNTAPSSSTAQASGEYEVADCGCNNFNDYLTNNSLSPTDHTGITNQLIADNYIVSSVEYYPEWVTYCSMNNPLFMYLDISNFPMDFYCVDQGTILALSQEGITCGNSYEQTLSVYNENVQIAQDLMVWNYISGYLSIGAQGVRENFTLEYENNLLHYTLYYYDQAGNLIKTVPPKGANYITNFTAVDDYRDDFTGNITHPAHDYITNYQYNSLNNITSQTTPDGGTTKFWYDELGRLILSQNAKQLAEGSFSYTLYDALGRTVEVGKVSDITLDESKDLITAPVNGSEDAFDNPFNFWINTGELSEITRTWYDETISTSVNNLFQPVDDLALGQQNLRMRVVSSTYYEGPVDGGLKDNYTLSEYRTQVNDYGYINIISNLDIRDPDEYISASHYSYDLHGNVERLIQEKIDPITSIRASKHMRYEYDLVSGNVNMVHYQEGELDDYHHKYIYDADNRITEVEISRDGVIWENQVKYYYYAHGPLARIEVGEEQVQGQDYAYTLQGWLKSVNSGSLNVSDDPGQDAGNTAGNLNKAFGKDMFGFNLHYFDNDYKANGGNQDHIVDFNRSNMGVSPTLSVSLNQYGSLYNGNIAQMITALPVVGTQGTAYTYDILNRIKSMDVFEASASTLSNHDKLDQADNTTAANHTFYGYDPDGNITNLRRWNHQSTLMDNLNYTYYHDEDIPGTYINTDGQTVNYTGKNTNRLAWFHDPQGVQPDGLDIHHGTFTGNNKAMYDYDELGNLTKDDLEEIAEIKWTLGGKIKEIVRETGSTKSDLVFEYDPMGNRISKTVKPRTVSGLDNIDTWTTTHYVLDAQGNVMSTYTDGYEFYNTGVFTVTSALMDNGLYGSDRLGLDAGNIWGKQNLFWHADGLTGGNSAQPPMALLTWHALPPGYYLLDPSVGFYLKSTGITQTVNATFQQDIQIAQGQAQISGLTPSGGYYQLKANEQYSISFDNSSNVDLPAVAVNIAVPAASTLIDVGIASGMIFSGIDLYKIDDSAPTYDSKAFTLSENWLGKKTYEFKNHLGNVLLTVSDRKLPDSFVTSPPTVNRYKAEVLSYSDYYPFGMQMPGRNANPGSYRYGYQGSEMDNELKGVGNSYTTYYRGLDPRLARWFSVDPVFQPWQSPYTSMDNSPIALNDVMGDRTPVENDPEIKKDEESGKGDKKKGKKKNKNKSQEHREKEKKKEREYTFGGGDHPYFDPPDLKKVGKNFVGFVGALFEIFIPDEGDINNNKHTEASGDKQGGGDMYVNREGGVSPTQNGGYIYRVTKIDILLTMLSSWFAGGPENVYEITKRLADSSERAQLAKETFDDVIEKTNNSAEKKMNRDVSNTTSVGDTLKCKHFGNGCTGNGFVVFSNDSTYGHIPHKPKNKNVPMQSK